MNAPQKALPDVATKVIAKAWLVFAAGLAVSCATVGSDAPQVGALIKSSDREIGQWEVFERGFWCSALNESCSYALLAKGKTILVAITKPTVKGPRGGYEQEVITKSFEVQWPRGYDRAECSGSNIVFSIINLAQKKVRSYRMQDGNLTLHQRSYAGDPPCDMGEN